MKALSTTLCISHFDYVKWLCYRLYGWLGNLNVIKVPFRYLLWAMCGDVQLRNRCVHEFLILTRTWFAFGLPSKTGCDTLQSRGPRVRLWCTSWGLKACEPRRNSSTLRIAMRWGKMRWGWSSITASRAPNTTKSSMEAPADNPTKEIRRTRDDTTIC
jgi:hypothetical protein